MSDQRHFTLGVVEGFYGVFYTFPERVELIRFIGRHGYNLYVYAPKNDRQHRARWWEAYPQRILDEFAVTVEAARQAGVSFCYAISPGGSIGYSSPEDFARLTTKLHGFFEIGVRAFSLMMDDNDPRSLNATDAARYASPSQAQADLANRLYAWLQSLDPGCTLSFVPADYSGRPPFSASINELGWLLEPGIELCYTGPEICSPEITAEDARSFAQAARRKPLIWDNYPVNDLAMQPELHLGPLSGRAADLPREVTGILVNPMAQAEASKIPLLTCAAYMADPAHYEPDAAWEAAAREVAGEGCAAALRVLAENADASCLCPSCRGFGGEKLGRLAVYAVAGLRREGLDAPELRELECGLAEIDEAGYALKFRLENLALRNNLLPWIEVLEHWMWMSRFCLRVLRDLQEGQPYLADFDRVLEYREAIRTRPKRLATDALIALFDYTLGQIARGQREQPQARVSQTLLSALTTLEV